MGLKLFVKEAVTPDMVAGEGTTKNTLIIPSHGLQSGNSIVNLSKHQARRVFVLDEDRLWVNDVEGQEQGDNIRLFTYFERTNLLKSKSLKILKKTQNTDSCSFMMVIENGYLLSDGQEINVVKDDVMLFGGVVTEAKRKILKDTPIAPLILKVKAEGFNSLPARRTVTADAINTTAGEVVELLIEMHLSQDGFRTGTIMDGASIGKYPNNDTLGAPISAKRLLDDMAELSGFIWYIDLERNLHFVQEEPVIDAPHELTDESAFKDFRNVNAQETAANYRNKQFVRGGTDEFGNMILVSGEYVDEIRARQRKEGNSGVYGHLIEDENITRAVKKEAQEGSYAEFLVIPNHGLNSGDMIVNLTRDSARSNVLVHSQDSLILYFPIEGQSQGDEIVWYPEANQIFQNKLKKYGKTNPGVIEFETGSVDFTPGMKLNVDLSILGEESQGTYLIENVGILDVGKENVLVRVTATKRDENEFSTQKSEGWTEYFDGLGKKGRAANGGGAITQSTVFVKNIDLYNNGMVVDYDDDTTYDFDFVLDNGDIVEIVNNTEGKSTTIDWKGVDKE